ncbi:MAG: protein-L-isoaspartate(D-aspartate) O-methyltransferase [Candidatus Aureabacteria bacterium]|nr:protein-L-isoaspartate(D-aspartate) O-methyltransferase [Candidatus Auribacterota bacterium]
MQKWTEKRKEMVEQQIQARGISDKKVLEALLKIERHIFIPEGSLEEAYEDYPVPIGCGQTVSQPYIVALMTELLQLSKNDRVLEIGTGAGYQTAVLASLVKEVFTMEIIPELASSAEKRLKEYGYHNIFFRCCDGHAGWKEHAPYEKICVTAAPAEIPSSLVEQLVVGGKMVIPIGTWTQELLLLEKQEHRVITKETIGVRFVPMVKGK